MKRGNLILVLVVMLISCAACGKTKTGDGTTVSQQEQNDLLINPSPAEVDTSSENQENDADMEIGELPEAEYAAILDLNQIVHVSEPGLVTEYEVPKVKDVDVPEEYGWGMNEHVINSKGVYYVQEYSTEMQQFATTHNIIYWNTETGESKIIYRCGRLYDDRNDTVFLNEFWGTEDYLIWVETIALADDKTKYEIRCMDLDTETVETIHTRDDEYYFELCPQINNQYIMWYEPLAAEKNEMGIFCYSLENNTIQQIGEEYVIHLNNPYQRVNMYGMQCVYAVEDGEEIKIIEENLEDGTKIEYEVPEQCEQVNYADANETAIYWEKNNGNSYLENGCYVYIKESKQLYYMPVTDNCYFFCTKMGSDSLYINLAQVSGEGRHVLGLSLETFSVTEYLPEEAETQGIYGYFGCTQDCVYTREWVYDGDGSSYKVYSWKR